VQLGTVHFILTILKRAEPMTTIDRTKIPKHLLYLSDQALRNLFALFPGAV